MQHRPVHGGLYAITDGMVYLLVKMHGGFGATPLVCGKGAKGPVPRTVATPLLAASYHHLVRERGLLLPLFHAHIVGCHVVYIHVHVVAQILVRGGGGEGSPCAEHTGERKACIDHAAAVQVGGAGGRGFGRSLLVQQSIRKGMLVYILIIHDGIERELAVGLP